MIRQALARQFAASLQLTRKNSEGISHEESLIAPREGGSSLNWVVGHMLSTRNKVFESLGQPLAWGDDLRELYGRGSEGRIDANAAAPFPELLAGYAASQERLAEALADTSDEALEEKLAKPHPFLGETVGELITTLAFHEAYHAGQTGVLRRLLGKESAIG